MHRIRRGPWVVGIVALCSVLLCWWMAETTAVHGDLVYFEAFYRDFFVLHHPISLFHFTEATFIFPDFLAMTVIRSAVRNGLWAILVYELLFVLSLALILGKLFRDFWVARLVTFTSRERIQVNQVKLNTSLYNWESSPLWYREDLYGRRIDRTTFFIPSRPDEREAALAHWGRPTGSFECPSRWGDLDVMLYPNGIDAAPEDRSRPN